MEKLIPLTPEEAGVLKQKLKSNRNDLVKYSLIGLALGTITIFIPLDILGKARRQGITGSLVENNGLVSSFTLMIGTITFFGLIWYFLTNHRLKKDLKLNMKVSEMVKIRRIEHLSYKLASEMEGAKDTILHFEKNAGNIKTFYFNKEQHPEYLDATKLLIERAKYS